MRFPPSSKRAAAQLAILVGLGAAACSPVPQQNLIVSGKRGQVVAVDVGKDNAGNACVLDAPAHAAYGRVFCGKWTTPSARISLVREDGDTAALADSGRWRTGIDRNFDCAEPRAILVAGQPAARLACARRRDGVRQVAMLARLGGKNWGAVSSVAAEPTAQLAMAVLSGVVSAKQVPASAVRSGLVARRLAAEAGSGGSAASSEQYDELVAAGRRASRSGDFVGAEAAFAQAVRVHPLIVADSSDQAYLIRDLAYQAVQVSNQGRDAEAQSLLNRADALLRHASRSSGDADLWAAELTHCTGLVRFNEGRFAEAVALLRDSEAQYAAIIDTYGNGAGVAANGSAAALVEAASRQAFVNNDILNSAVPEFIDAKRHEAAALRHIGDVAGSNAAALEAQQLADTQLEPGRPSSTALRASMFQTTAFIAEDSHEADQSLQDFGQSRSYFNQFEPDSYSAARTTLLQAARQAAGGANAQAAASCRAATAALQADKSSVEPGILMPCLDAVWAARPAAGDEAAAREMFAMAQLGQSSTTSLQIAATSVRMRQDSRVDALIARQSEAAQELAAATADIERLQGDQADQAKAEARRAEARRAMDAAEESLQQELPGYDQLVEASVSADEVISALQPGEALVSMVFGADHGWVFLVRDGHVQARRSDAGQKQIATLVSSLRASVDSEGAVPPPYDTASAYKLYRAVLGGVAPGLHGATSLIVAPAGPLLSVPFAILLTAPASPDELAGAPWLVRQFPVSHLPAPASLVSLRKIAVASRAPRPFFGFGDFRPVVLPQALASFPIERCGHAARDLARLPELPGSRFVLAQTAAALGASDSETMTGARFTVANVTATDLTRYRVLLFATHASLPTDLACEAEPALVTSAPPDAADASGALLTESRIVRLHLDADLVILDGCSTGGEGVAGKGEALSGLARAFIAAKARALLVTHWPASDKATALIVTDFVNGAKADSFADPAASLAHAQLNLLADAKGNLANIAHPHWWGNLALVGVGSVGAGRITAAGL